MEVETKGRGKDERQESLEKSRELAQLVAVPVQYQHSFVIDGIAAVHSPARRVVPPRV